MSPTEKMFFYSKNAAPRVSLRLSHPELNIDILWNVSRSVITNYESVWEGTTKKGKMQNDPRCPSVNQGQLGLGKLQVADAL